MRHVGSRLFVSGQWGCIRQPCLDGPEVEAALLRDGIPVYLPMIREWPRPAVGGEFAGRHVTITDGPLRGLPAVIQQRMTGRQRVLVLLDLLQRPTRVELPDRWLRLA